MSLESDFEEFVSDEPAAIEQLRSFVGGELTRCLDLRVESLALLDEYVTNLTASPDWDESPLLQNANANVRSWLTVRLAYYLAAVIRSGLGGSWRLEGDEPVLDLEYINISPLEIASACLRGEVDGGLSGLYTDLAAELAERSQAH